MLIDAVTSPWTLRTGAATAVRPISSSSMAMRVSALPDVLELAHEAVERGNGVGRVGTQDRDLSSNLGAVESAEQNLAV